MNDIYQMTLDKKKKYKLTTCFEMTATDMKNQHMNALTNERLDG